MNREELLKRCVERGVADETSIGAVSHLFYVYLLSGLQKGQRVEVPSFGTFGTRVVGVKRARKMPFFEPERELAEKVNERYKNLKYLVVGRYELVPAFGEEEYKGKEAPFDALVEEIGKESILDTHREITLEEYERDLAGLTPSREKKPMPKLNLKEEEEREPVLEETAPPATLRDIGGETRGGMSPVLLVALGIVILGALTFALNYFGVIHLWGKKAPTVVTTLPEPERFPPPVEAEPPVEPTPTPTPTPTPEPVKPRPVEPPRVEIPPSGTGDFTVQVSSWITMGKANEEAARLKAGGLDAFVQEGMVGGERWYRVRVGRYATQREAAEAAKRLQAMLENGIWVARIGSM